MNKVLLIGRLTKGVDMTQTTSGNAIAKFTVAVDRGKDRNGESKGADFINCVAFGKTAENMDRYSYKGMLVGVEGNFHTDSYEKDGRKIYTSNVNVDRVEFLSKQTEKPDTDPVPTGFEKADDIPF